MQNPAFPALGTFPGVLLNVGTFTLGGGRANEVRFNGADNSQANQFAWPKGFNIPLLLSVHETRAYFYSGLAQTLGLTPLWLQSVISEVGSARDSRYVLPHERAF